MTRRALMMSAKKRAALKKQEAAEKYKEQREREELLKPLFAHVKKTTVKLAKVEDYRAPDTKHLKSLNADGDFSGATARKENQKYTGDLLTGIATMHKSNMVPIFNKEEAVLVATMRRN